MLLYSAPVTSSQIIAGKFLAMSTLFVRPARDDRAEYHFRRRDRSASGCGFACSGAAGVAVLIWAYAAIGLFMSSLTGYQIVAVLLTLGALYFARAAGQYGARPSIFWRDLTYWASISGRTETIYRGVDIDRRFDLFRIGDRTVSVVQRFSAAGTDATTGVGHVS